MVELEASAMDETEEELLKWASDELKNAVDDLNAWRGTASTCYDFYSIQQWNEDDSEILEDERGSATVTFDRVTRTINAVAGAETQNRQEPRFFPRHEGVAAVSEFMTGALRSLRDSVFAEHEESEAFLDTLITGMGWISLSLDADQDETQLRIERVDPLECLWDVKAQRRNLSDTKWRARIKNVSKKELLELWPDADMGAIGSGTRYLEYSSTPRDVSPPRYRETMDGNRGSNAKDDKGYEIVEFEYWDYETYYQLLTEQGELTEFSPEQWEKVGAYAEQNGLEYTKRKRKVFSSLYFSGNEILQLVPSIAQTDFTLRCMTGLRNRNQNTWFGLVSLMLDPQRWANKWLSQILHVVNVNAKGGLLAETDAFDSVRQAENSWAMADSITWLRSGGLQKIQERSFGQVPAGIDRLLQYAMEAIDSVSGVNVEMLGSTDRDQPGVVEESRKRAGITIVAVFFDALKLYHKSTAPLVMELIRKYIADGRLIRVWGERGVQYVPLLRDSLAVKYDVIVDESPSSPSIKERTFGALSQILPMALQAGIAIPPEIISYVPLPESLVEKWKEALQPQPPDPEQQAKQQQAEQLQIASQMAMVKELESKAALNMAEAQAKAQDGEVRLQEMQLKMQSEGQEQQARMLRQALEAEMKQAAAAAEFELVKLRQETDVQTKREALAAETQLAHLRLELDTQKQLMAAIETGFKLQMQKNEFEQRVKMDELKECHQQELILLKKVGTQPTLTVTD